ncbi:MAG TPA: DUF255 domain-containing protein [Armatimonadaceae bacterium]|nr:DUF255 domain-containing protein [Armatimonadaceae bacterium]
MTQIAWRAWSDEVFAEARADDKPVLLSMHAVWCQWCRTMDEQTYGNEAIAQFVDDNFIPVRVDTDKRPDIYARYQQGGWPSTAVLTPEGDVMWAGTFVPPDGMAQLLPQIQHAYRNDKPGLEQLVTNQREQIRQQRDNAPPLDPALPVTPEIVRNALLSGKFMFDFAFGGFRGEQNPAKFPHVDVVELFLQQLSRAPHTGEDDADIAIVLEKTLSGMADGGLHDREAGGFFRYTQTPDWRDPHHEKLLEDNALLARLYARAYQILGDERWKDVSAKTLRYLDTTLYDAETGTWGGSQAADAEYYAQPIEERKEWNPPRVDPTILTGPNAQAVRAHVAWWQATGDAAALAMGRKGLDYLIANALKQDGALDHFIGTDEDVENAGRIPTGLLGDAADVTAACLDLYEAGQGVEYLEHAENVANWVQGHLEDPRSGGLYDSVTHPNAVGTMKIGTKDVTDNMQMSDALLRLFLSTGEEEHARLAQRILQAFLPASPQLGYYGAGFALAAERALLPPILVHILGPAGDKATKALINAAHRVYRFERFVQPLDPNNEEDAEHIENLGYDKPDAPLAYVCVGTRCLEPVSDTDALANLVKTVN